jgi:hypothetical protein
MELSLHGLGCGSARYSELTALLASAGTWHGGTVYYNTESIKCFSFCNVASNNITEHKLPACLARVYLLFVVAMEHRYGKDSNNNMQPSVHVVNNINNVNNSVSKRRKKEKSMMLPTIPNRQHFLNDAISELFHFTERPTLWQVRQLWTSVCNIVFVNIETNANGSILVAPSNNIEARMSGHSLGTHKVWYGSELANSRELIYEKYHCVLGDKNLNVGHEYASVRSEKDNHVYNVDNNNVIDQLSGNIFNNNMQHSVNVADNNINLSENSADTFVLVTVAKAVQNVSWDNANLHHALQYLFGREAVFTSSDQFTMCEASLKNRSSHTHVNLPCGAGKSLAWLLPVTVLS